MPDLAAFPRTAWLRAERSVLKDLSASDLGYGDPRGAPELRRAVVNWLARNRGIRVDAGEVLVTSGTAQGLGLLAQVLGADGIRTMAVEDPGSLGTRQHLRNWRMETPPVAVDAEGVRVDELRATGARAVLLTPAHQFPTGVVLGGVRRRELMRWAGEGGLIDEDDYDAEHRYDRPPVPALRSVLAEHVCYAGSVSKLLAPALRVGWMLAPPKYRDALVDAKRFADLGNPVLPQLVLARLMESGGMERQLRLLRRRHRTRRDAMIAAIWGTPSGGGGARCGGGPAPRGHLRRSGIRRHRHRTSRPRRSHVASRCSRCRGTGSARAAPVSSWGTPRRRRAGSRRGSRCWATSCPEGGDRRPQVGEEPAQQRQRQADDVAGVTVDAVDGGAERPSRVKAPATWRGSPVATYAAISASVGSPKRTVVDAVAEVRRPVAVSITQCPVRRTPERPRMDFQRAVASSASAGLPSARPSSSSTESQPMTRARRPPGGRRRTRPSPPRVRGPVRRAWAR